MLNAVLARIDQNQNAAIERLFALMRIPSISTDPAYAEDCTRAADWLVDDLTSIGFTATRHDTPGRPMVVARHVANGPHILFYGHYDVQPVDPLEDWNSPPFEPQLEDGAHGKLLRGRGSADDKGQLMTFVEACRAFKEVTGTLPGNITILLEGEEESGSPSLIPFLEAHKGALSADIALVCDTNMWNRETPAITTSLRGTLAEEVTLHGARIDLHSGMYGGAAVNPIHILARALGALHDAHGRITLPGFYNGVPKLDKATRAAWAALDFSEAAFLGAVGLGVPAGESGFSVLENIWARPTAEVNGIWGGYTGPGFKTVLPANAYAKVSFRLVGDQDPEAIRASFRAWLQAQIPADMRLSFKSKDGSRGLNMQTDAPVYRRSAAALGEEWGQPAAMIGSGVSIPIVALFRSILGMDSALIGFGQEDDAIHSPNEKYDLRSFHKGARSWARILDDLCRGGWQS